MRRALIAAIVGLGLAAPSALANTLAQRDGLAFNAALSRCLDYTGCHLSSGGRVENDVDTSRYVYHFTTTYCGTKRLDIIVHNTQVALYSSGGNC